MTQAEAIEASDPLAASEVESIRQDALAAEQIARISHDRWLHSTETQKLLKGLTAKFESHITAALNSSLDPAADPVELRNHLVSAATVRESIKLCQFHQ